MRLTEDTLHLDAAPLETLPLRPGVPLASYPFPALRLRGDRLPMAFRVVTLENEWMKATVALDLGGRILDLHDRRTGVEVLGRVTDVAPTPGGLRGAELRQGIEFVVGTLDRATRMAPVRHLARDEGEDDTPCVVVYDLVSDAGIALHASFELDGDTPSIRLALRAQNVTLNVREGRLGLRVPFDAVPVRTSAGVGFYDEARDAGVVVRGAPGEIVRVEATEGGGYAVLTHVNPLAPLETISTELWITPISGIGVLSAFGADAALGVSEEFIRLQAHRPLNGEKLFVRNSEGHDLEAPLDVQPPIPFAARREGSIADPIQIALRNLQRETVLEWPGSPVALDLEPAPLGLPAEFRHAVQAHVRDESTLRRAGKTPACAVASRMLLAGQAARDENYAGAMALLDDALERDGQNAIAWWFKAIIRRRWSEGGDESPERLNAHFLAPLDPMLRAESFLSQPAMMEKDPSPLVAPLANDPEALILPAVLLIEFGLDDEASRWIDEALRHRPDARLHYLLAWRLLQDSRMAVEAAEHVRKAEEVEVQPPFPWHSAERLALTVLAARFPDAAQLAALARLASENP
jgi:hypothetical protein